MVGERSLTVAADVEAQYLSSLARATDVPGVSGYKVGLALGLEISLPETVRRIKEHSDKEITYDHQKAGNDIRAMGKDFARVCRAAGVDNAILFPFSSPDTEEGWIKALQDAGVGVLVGGHMTVPKFLESEGGYIADSAPERIYRLGADLGVKDFVVPGNKIEYVTKYKELLDEVLGEDNFTLHAPGFITQGGVISEFGNAAGRKWRAIAGSAFYQKTDPDGGKRMATEEEMHEAALEMTSQIR